MSYQSFVVISYLRSGTHLLRTALESHPEIVCQTEVFNSDNPNIPYPLSMPTQEVLDKWVNCNIDSKVDHVGFVLQAYHPYALTAFPGIRPNPHWNDIWTILQANLDLKVIHLRRDNLLRRHLSHMQARASGQWHNWDSKQLEHISLLEALPQKHIDQYQQPKQPLTLDAKMMEQDFEEVEKWHELAEKKFQKHSNITLKYEDLQHDFAGQCQRVLTFLGASSRPLFSGVRKLESRTLDKSIANYPSLKQSFSKSKWCDLFDV